MPPSVSIIIRAFNEEAHIGRLLTGIAKQSLPSAEIILVDSGSTDATVAIARAFPGVRVLTIDPGEFSFGRSLNLGCSEARGDLLVFASAHVYPLYDDWLETLTAPFADSEVALVYGRQQGDQAVAYPEDRILSSWFPDRSVKRQDHPFCNNANCAIRRDLWQRLPYDESLTGLEDIDWAKRALELGFHLSYAAEAAVVHVHDESFRQVINRYEREAIAHSKLYDDQRLGLGETIRLALANLITDYYHAGRDGVLASNLMTIPRFRVAQFLGSYRGFKQRGDVGDVLKRRFYYPAGLERQLSAAQRRRERLIDYEGRNGAPRSEQTVGEGSVERSH